MARDDTINMRVVSFEFIIHESRRVLCLKSEAWCLNFINAELTNEDSFDISNRNFMMRARENDGDPP